MSKEVPFSLTKTARKGNPSFCDLWLHISKTHVGHFHTVTSFILEDILQGWDNLYHSKVSVLFYLLITTVNFHLSVFIK